MIAEGLSGMNYALDRRNRVFPESVGTVQVFSQNPVSRPPGRFYIARSPDNLSKNLLSSERASCLKS
ncbi:MAG: hypothetical protein HC849_15675 [Oscillatoriales cyanobacterium RU_3_3]|nr:hypothetical protein [Oscillatoriales cyanobacterium RU_3_3]